jgi:hypothetical protein
MRAKKEIPAICEAVLGKLPERAQWTWAALADLEKSHKSSIIIADFREWATENAGDDFPRGILKSYLDVASSRLSSVSGSSVASAKDPEVVSLARELSYLSGGVVAFLDKQRIRLADVLKEFSAVEITSAFKTWLDDQDLSDPKNVSFLPGKFVQIVDGLCYSAKRRKQEADQALITRNAQATRLQQEAEAERAEAEQKRLAEENSFDPLSGL